MMLLYNREFILDSYINEREQIVRAEERAKAEKQSRETARSLHGMGLSVENIATAINYSVDTIRQWLNLPAQEVLPNA